MPEVGDDFERRGRVGVVFGEGHQGLEEASLAASKHTARAQTKCECLPSGVALPRARERLRAAGQALLMGRWGAAHYAVSGGPMIMTSHSKTLASSLRPAEKPSTGCLFNSARQEVAVGGEASGPSTRGAAGVASAPLSCFMRRSCAWSEPMAPCDTGAKVVRRLLLLGWWVSAEPKLAHGRRGRRGGV